MKIITLTVSDDATITVDGVEYAPKGTNAKTPERVLWTPRGGETVSMLVSDGAIRQEVFIALWQQELDAGNVFPAEGDYDAAAKRHREAQSVIDRYCYAKGIDTRWKEGVHQWGAYIGDGEIFTCESHNICDGSPIWAETKAIAEQIIADCGAEIRTVLLRGWV